MKLQMQTLAWGMFLRGKMIWINQPCSPWLIYLIDESDNFLNFNLQYVYVLYLKNTIYTPNLLVWYIPHIWKATKWSQIFNTLKNRAWIFILAFLDIYTFLFLKFNFPLFSDFVRQIVRWYVKSKRISARWWTFK